MGSPGGSFGYPPGKGKGFNMKLHFSRFSFFFTRHDFYTARLGSRGSLFTEEVTSGKSRKTKEKEKERKRKRNERERRERKGRRAAAAAAAVHIYIHNRLG